MPNFRKGAEAIQETLAKAKEGGGNFKPFTPKFFWYGDGAEKYLRFLNPLHDIPEVSMISFIKQNGKKRDGSTFTYYEETIARTEPGLDNPRDKDPMVEDWKATPRQIDVAAAVELIPVYTEGRGGRKKVTGFEVATREFNRKVRDKDGNSTDEVETVEAPSVGFVQQSPHNFFNVVTSFDAKTGPINEIPCRIDQVGSGSDTTYTMTGFEPDDLPDGVDLSALIECIDGISYLTHDEQEELYDAVDGLSDDEAVAIIGATLLDKRMTELADDDRYQELYDGITEEFRQFGNKSKGKQSGSPKRERRSRGSQRRDASTDDGEPEADNVTQEDNAQEPAPEEEAPKTRRRGRAKVAEEAAPADDGPKQESTEHKDRLAELRARAEQRAAAK
jgi:hypothetical protein